MRGGNTLALRGGLVTIDRVSPTILPATSADVPTILSFIRELAEYEKLLDRVTATEDLLRHTLFGPRPYAEVLVARLDDDAVGYALFFHSYSTFLARPGVYLEDVYVRPAARGNGVGKALLKAVARAARDRGCGRVEWAVLKWNTPAIEFYESLGAQPLDGWTTYRMDEAAIAKLAE
jgi:GNAT superfamily N-acetyltransferase